MFGYVTPNHDELKVREARQYRAYYCGLCRALKKGYGETARLTLNYDCTFLAILLSALEEPQAEPFFNGHCAYKLFLKERPIAKYTDALGFAADLEVLLSFYKSLDDWRDERSLKGAGGRMALGNARKKAEKRNPALADCLKNGLLELDLLEKGNCAELDAPADAFARILSNALAFAPALDPKEKIVLSKLSYNIGKWIYLADAWEDREKDKKSGSYNPFLASEAGEERASFLLHYSLNEAISAYELLDVKSNAGILDNIMYVGCRTRTQRLLGGGNEQSL